MRNSFPVKCDKCGMSFVDYIPITHYCNIKKDKRIVAILFGFIAGFMGGASYFIIVDKLLHF
jgi:hypothetical protein